MKAKVSRLGEYLKLWYQRTKCDCKIQGELTLERIRAASSAWPKLKAKAAATRKPMPFALEIALSFATSDRSDSELYDVEQTMIEICRLMVRFYECLDTESQFFGDEVRAEMPILGQRVAELYSKLAIYFFQHAAVQNESQAAFMGALDRMAGGGVWQPTVLLDVSR